METVYYLAIWKDDTNVMEPMHTGEQQHMLYTMEGAIVDRADVYLNGIISKAYADNLHAMTLHYRQFPNTPWKG